MKPMTLLWILALTLGLNVTAVAQQRGQDDSFIEEWLSQSYHGTFPRARLDASERHAQYAAGAVEVAGALGLSSFLSNYSNQQVDRSLTEIIARMDRRIEALRRELADSDPEDRQARGPLWEEKNRLESARASLAAALEQTHALTGQGIHADPEARVRGRGVSRAALIPLFLAALDGALRIGITLDRRDPGFSPGVNFGFAAVKNSEIPLNGLQQLFSGAIGR